MNQAKIDRFINYASLQLPLLMSQGQVTGTELEDDRAVIEFTPKKAPDVLRLLDDLEDILELIILYHVMKEDDRPSSSQRCCAYSEPTFEYIYKVNALCNGSGRCEALYVTLYDSLETLGFDLLDELREQTKGSRVIYSRGDQQVLTDFL